MQVHANEGGVTQTRGGIYWIILPAGCKSLVPHFILSFFSSNTQESYISLILRKEKRSKNRPSTTTNTNTQERHPMVAAT
jgi:hypothetical protein